jgi:riboflavin-specific deaminase-like protein
VAVAEDAPDETIAWALLLLLARRGGEAARIVDGTGLALTSDGALDLSARSPFVIVRPDSPRGWSWPDAAPRSAALELLLDLYMPLCVRERVVVGHLAQTLDGRIATGSGKSQFISGKESLLHTHRLRALFDVVLVGRRTVEEDDPQLTTRLCSGPSPVRVVIDPERRLRTDRRVFSGEGPKTLLFCTREAARGERRHGNAEIVEIESANGKLPVHAIVAELARRGLHRTFVEGGGLTVSSFLAAGAMERLHMTVSPVMFGSGRPSVTLPEIQELRDARTLAWRHFAIGPDVLFDCVVPT